MKGFDACFRLADRLLQRRIEAGFGFGEFGVAHRQLGELAAVVAARQRAQAGVAVGAHLIEYARHRRAQLFAALLRGTAQRRATRRGIQRSPFQNRQRQIFQLRVHARIFSTGSTSSWLAPARFMSSRCVQVMAP